MLVPGGVVGVQVVPQSSRCGANFLRTVFLGLLTLAFGSCASEKTVSGASSGSPFFVVLAAGTLIAAAVFAWKTIMARPSFHLVVAVPNGTHTIARYDTPEQAAAALNAVLGFATPR